MADIFISYARPDRARVEALAAALEAAGYSVWWDREIAVGDSFSATIESELDAAGVVIVAWSGHGTQSDWVRDEAGYARRQDKFLPVLLDASEPPMGFRQVQAADLTGWHGDADSPGFKELLASISRKLKLARSAPATPAAAGARKNGPLIALAALASLAALSWWLWPKDSDTGAPQTLAPVAEQAEEASSASGNAVTLAVLPFVNMSTDPEQEFFADGLTEELLNWLANVEGLKVPGRTTSFMFKGKTDDLRDIGQRLGVDYLLEGSVRHFGERLRITAQLIEAANGFHLWSETYDREILDLFAIQDEIAREVVTELLGALPEAAWQNPAAVDVDPRAHEHYLAGRAYWSGRDGEAALHRFSQAVAIDPDHALAWAYLSIVKAHRWFNKFGNVSDLETLLSDARVALQRAKALQPRSADVLYAEAWLQRFIEGEQASAKTRQLLQAALKADPRHVEAMHMLANAESDLQQKTARYRRLLEVDPGLSVAHLNLTSVLLHEGELNQARELAHQRLLQFPDEDRFFVAVPFRTAGRMDLLTQFLFDLNPDLESDTWGNLLRAAVLADLGAVSEALSMLARQVGPGLRGSVAAYGHAELLGDPEAQIELVERLSWWAPSCVLLKTGHPQEALDTALQVRPELVPADAARIGQRINHDFALSGPEVCGALALNSLGRTDEGRKIFEILSEAMPGFFDSGWRKPFISAALLANAGDMPGATANFSRAYQAGFRFLRSAGHIQCDPCLDTSLVNRTGAFAVFAGNAEFDAIVAQIEADNTRLLKQVEQRTGILARIREELGAPN